MTATSAGHEPAAAPVGGPGWRQHLHRLEDRGLVLLPIGAKPPDRKVPVDPETGNGLSDWQNHPGFTAEAIAGMNPVHVIGACINTGPSDLDVLDIDGPAAVAWLEARGLDPRDPALFRITRTTDPDRFKIPFRLTPEQRQQLPLIKTLLRVGEPDGEGKRQALELYAKKGAQVIVLGFHTKSRGWYDWAGDPSQVAAPSDAWMEAMVVLCAEVEALRGKGDTSRPPSRKGVPSAGRGGWRGSSKAHPCPVCGRDHSSACTTATGDNGRRLVSCFHGGSFSAPEGLNKGDTTIGRDGNTWALLYRYQAEGLGEKSLFIDHRARARQAVDIDPADQAKERPAGHGRQPPALATPAPWEATPAGDDGAADDLPPPVTPERLAEIAEALAALDRQRGEQLASIPSPEGLEEEIRGCGLGWPADRAKVMEITDRIGQVAAFHDLDKAERVALRDLLIETIGGGPRGDLSKRIEAAAAAFDPYGGTKAERDQLIAERDARDLAIAAHQQRQEAAAAAEARERRLITATGVEAILLAIGNGWQEQEEGGPKRSHLPHGQMFDTLRRDMPGRLRFNLRGLVPMIDGEVPEPRDLQDLYVRLNSQGWIISKEHAIDSVVAAADRDAFDPFLTYLEHAAASVAPVTDDTWGALDHYLLGIDDPVARRFLPQYLISAAARTYLPGCDVRRSPVLIGPEEIGKTAAGRILFGPELYVSNLTDMGRDDQLRCHSAACVELSELDGITRRADQEHLKAFLTEVRDNFRAPYGSATSSYPRRFVFWGTSNSPPLRGNGGNTRFVCIELPGRRLPLDWLREHRDALWARAVLEFRASRPVLGVHEPWNQYSEADRLAFADRNANHLNADPWQEQVERYLARRLQTADVPVTVPDILKHLDVPTYQQNPAAAARARAVAEGGGWQYQRRRLPGDVHPRRGLWPPEAVPPVPPRAGGEPDPGTGADGRPGPPSAAAVPGVPGSISKEVKGGETSTGEGAGAPARVYRVEGERFAALPPAHRHTPENPRPSSVSAEQPPAQTRAGVPAQPPPPSPWRPRISEAVELLQPDGTWRNGATVQSVRPARGQDVVLLLIDGRTEAVALDQIRPCPEVA